MFDFIRPSLEMKLVYYCIRYGVQQEFTYLWCRPLVIKTLLNLDILENKLVGYENAMTTINGDIF